MPRSPLVSNPCAAVVYSTELVTGVPGYFTMGKRMTDEELQAVQGRMWEE
jgi:hypothetical protein